METDITPDIEFAFVVAVDSEGKMYLERKQEAVSLPVKREATMLEVRRCAQDLLEDLRAQGVAEYVVAAFVAASDAAQEKAGSK